MFVHFFIDYLGLSHNAKYLFLSNLLNSLLVKSAKGKNQKKQTCHCWIDKEMRNVVNYVKYTAIYYSNFGYI